MSKELRKCLKALLDFFEISRKMLENERLKGNYDIDIIYHLKNSLNQYFRIKRILGFDKK